MPHSAYIRKSRKDIEAEQQGAGETLARHRRILLELARRNGHVIDQIYEEIVSGDSIAERAMMQQLLADVQAGKWSGVYVYEVERLARGDTIDQGIVAQTFQYSGTLIITPQRTFNPANEADSEYFEFGLFMSRREYNTTKRRLMAGRWASHNEGKYLGSRDPFGYQRYKLPGQKGWSLRIVPEQAKLVRWAADVYLHGRDVVDPLTGQTTHEPVGAQIIANEFNAMGVTTTLGNQWTANGVRHMLQWPGYIGKVQWFQRETKVAIVDGQRQKSRPVSDKYSLQDGLHEPILDQSTWDQLQATFAGRKKGAVNTGRKVMSPLNGLVKCSECGKAMIRTPMYGHLAGIDYLKCSTVGCPTSSAPLADVESLILQTLQEWVTWVETDAWPTEYGDSSNQHTEDMRVAAQKHLDDLHKRRLRLMELLEQEIYDIPTYSQRNTALSEEIARAQSAIDALPPPQQDRRSRITALLPQLKALLQAYSSDLPPADRNALLFTVLDKVIYTKTRRCFRNENPIDHVGIELFPKSL
ncbi:MAG: recombinase family protein [Clostridiales bacterium]|nr:recombinase family protein [Clostridiales bacterium]